MGTLDHLQVATFEHRPRTGRHVVEDLEEDGSPPQTDETSQRGGQPRRGGEALLDAVREKGDRSRLITVSRRHEERQLDGGPRWPPVRHHPALGTPDAVDGDPLCGRDPAGGVDQHVHHGGRRLPVPGHPRGVESGLAVQRCRPVAQDRCPLPLPPRRRTGVVDVHARVQRGPLTPSQAPPDVVPGSAEGEHLPSCDHAGLLALERAESREIEVGARSTRHASRLAGCSARREGLQLICGGRGRWRIGPLGTDRSSGVPRVRPRTASAGQGAAAPGAGTVREGTTHEPARRTPLGRLPSGRRATGPAEGGEHRDERRHLLGRRVGVHHSEQRTLRSGIPGGAVAGHSGMFPCFLAGSTSRLERSRRSDRMISTRVSCGAMTASTYPRSAAM